MGFLDVAEVRTCKQCAAEVLRIRGRDDELLAVELDPGAVWDGATVRSGWRLVVEPGLRARWVVHLAHVSPHKTCVFRPHDCAPVQPITPTRGDNQVSNHDDDPFDKPDSRPSVSFKGAPIGATITCVVDGSPNKVQARDFETNKPAVWDDGNPKYTVATDVLVNDAPMTLWAQIPGSLFSAIAAAQTAAGAKIAKGGTLVVKLVGEKPNDNPRLNAQKLYEAHYTPPAAFDTAPPQQSTGVAVGSGAQATPAAQPAAAPAPPWATS